MKKQVQESLKSVYPASRKLLADRKISDAEKMTKSENFWLIDKFLVPKKRLRQKIFG